MNCKHLQTAIAALITERAELLERADQENNDKLRNKAGELKEIISTLKSLAKDCNTCKGCSNEKSTDI